MAVAIIPKAILGKDYYEDVDEPNDQIAVQGLVRSSAGAASLYADALTTTIAIGGGASNTTVTIGGASTTVDFPGTLTLDEIQFDSGIRLGSSTSITGATNIAIGDTTTATGANSIVMGYQADDNGADDSVIIGYQASSASIADDQCVVIGSSASSAGTNSIAMGYLAAVASADGVVVGDQATIFNSIVITVVDYTLGAGDTLTVTVNGVLYTLTEGVEFNAVTNNDTTATNIASALNTALPAGVYITPVAVGAVVTLYAIHTAAPTTGDATAWTVSAVNESINSVAIGSGATVPNNNATVVGCAAAVTGVSGTALGYLASAGNSCIAIGYNSEANSFANTVVGASTTGGAGSNVVVGYGADGAGASGFSVAVGYNAAPGSQGTCVGALSDSAGQSVAIGYNAQVTNNSSGGVGVGYAVSVTGQSSTAIGRQAAIPSADGVVVGHQAAIYNSIVITVVDYTLGAGDTLTVTVAGTAYTLTEGVEFSAVTDNGTTATNIASALDTALPAGRYVTPVAVGSVITLYAIHTAAPATGDATAWTVSAITESADSVVIGSGASTLATGCVVIGSGASTAVADSMAIGEGANASAATTIAIGPLSDATGSNGMAIGYNAQSTGDTSIVIGNSTSDGSHPDVVCIGYNATAPGQDSVVIGASAGPNVTPASGMVIIGTAAVGGVGDTVVIGADASSTGDDGTVIGRSATDNGADDAVVLGRGASVQADRCVAIGDGAANGAFADSIALGARAVTDAVNQAQIGSTASEINEVKVVSHSGSAYRVFASEEVLSGLSGATATTSGLVPAGARLLAIVARVTTTITGATTFDVGDGSDVDRFGAAIALVAGTTLDSSDATADPAGWSVAAQEVTLTANGSNFTAGAVRIVAYYFMPSAPTS